MMSDSSFNTDMQLEPHELAQQARQDEAFVVTHPWIRHYEQGVPAHIEIPDQPLTWLLERSASRYPDRTALIYFGKRLSYARLAYHAKSKRSCSPTRRSQKRRSQVYPTLTEVKRSLPLSC